jgi:hypothetical protein
MTKSFTTLLAAAALLFSLPSSVFAGFGFFGTNGAFAIFNSNGAGNTYYYFQDGSANTKLNTHDFGTFNLNLGNTFVLNGGEQQTFENSGDNVLDGSLFYRIYSGTPTGSFIQVAYNTLTFPGPAGDEKRTTTNANIDLLAGLSAGTYTIQLFNEANVDYNGQGGGSPEDKIWPNLSGGTLYNSNGGNQAIASSAYATFTVIPLVPVPEPATVGAGLVLVGFAGLQVIRRRKSLAALRS